MQAVGGVWWDYKGKKKKENFFTVVRNCLIELIASRCPGGQKNLVSKRDKTRTEPVIWVQTKTRPACLCHVLCFSLEHLYSLPSETGCWNKWSQFLYGIDISVYVFYIQKLPDVLTATSLHSTNAYFAAHCLPFPELQKLHYMPISHKVDTGVDFCFLNG